MKFLSMPKALSPYSQMLLPAFGLVFSIMASAGCAHIAKERASAVKWESFSEEKLKAALAGDQKVLVVVTATWCSACNWMKSTTFADPAIVDQLNAGFVAFALDVDEAPESAQRFMENGIPSTYALGSDGASQNSVVGYRNAEDYDRFLSGL